jgi:hypothetical protein
MVFPNTIKCSICGEECEHFDIESTNTFGASDLDTRPAEMARSTIEYWVQICPNCGFCAPDISESIDNSSKIIKSNEYIQQLKDPGLPELAKAFLCYSMILESTDEFAKAGWAIIHAAWVCDDNKQKSGADKCRYRAISLIQKADKNQQSFAKQKGLDNAILVDLLRRTGQFDSAMKICNETFRNGLDQIIIDILEFQKKLINKSDTGCHTIDEIEKSEVKR